MALGRSSQARRAVRPARSVCMTSRWPASIDFTPSTVLLMIGRKASTAAITTFEPMPKPNQTMNSGTSAILGTTCTATRIGCSARSSHATLPNRMPALPPSSNATRKPPTVSPSVTAAWA